MNLFYKIDLITTLLKYVLGFFLFFAFFSLSVLYYIMDFFSTFNITYSTNDISIFLFDYYSYDYLVNTNALNLNLVSVYYFPFIYIFVLITTLFGAILPCL